MLKLRFEPMNLRIHVCIRMYTQYYSCTCLVYASTCVFRLKTCLSHCDNTCVQVYVYSVLCILCMYVPCFWFSIRMHYVHTVFITSPHWQVVSVSGDLPVVRMLYQLEGEDEQDLAANLSTFPELFGLACTTYSVHLLHCTNDVWTHVCMYIAFRKEPSLMFPPKGDKLRVS